MQTPRRLVIACVLSSCISHAFGAEIRPSARADVGGHFGLHGPAYSHLLHAQAPNFWLSGEAIFNVLNETEVGWARQDFWWSLVEPERGRFEWADFDRAVEAYNRHDIRLMAILCYASAWSQGASPQDDAAREQFANYVFQMVSRYKDKVGAWEIWNEPNIQPFWTPRPDPELYAKLLIAAYDAAKRADPNCVVLGGAFAGPAADFLEGMYAHGAAGHFDVLSYHNYGQDLSMEHEWPAVKRLRAVLDAHGEGDKPIWQTETGIYTGPVGVSEQEQAAAIVRYSIGLLAIGVEKTFQLTLHDWSDDPHFHDQSSYRGVTHANLTQKPSFAAYRTMCRRLNGKRLVGLMRPAPGVCGFLFRDGAGESVAVLWGDERRPPEPRPVDLGIPVALVQTMMGDTQRMEEASGVYRLSIGGDPLYVFNPGPALANQALVRWPDGPATSLPRSAQATVVAEVTNPTEGEITMEIGPGGGNAAPVAMGVVPAHTTAQLTAHLDASTWPVGPQELAWSLTARVAQAEPKVLARGYRLVQIESPVALSFAPLRMLAEATPRLEARIAYMGADKAAGKLALLVNGQASAAPADVALKPGPAETIALPVSLASLKTARPTALALRLEALGLTLTTECKRKLIAAPAAPTNATVDGDLAEWRDRPPQVLPEQMSWAYVNARQDPPATDLAVTGWVAYDARGLWIAVQVKDDIIELPTARQVWEWDSLQVGLDLGSDARPDQGYDDNDLEVELGQSTAAEKWCYLGYCPPGWPEDALSGKLVGAVRVDMGAGIVDYELLVPVELLVSTTKLAPGAVFGFSIMVNDNDRDGRAGWQELTPGIGMGKSPWAFAWLWLQ